jgi:glycosyltransferase involved in cell wall biosynthesis
LEVYVLDSAGLLKRIFRKIELKIKRYTLNPLEKVVSLTPKNNPIGNVLISYNLQPFLLNCKKSIANTHVNYWRSLQMAKTFLEIGYSVDVIHYHNKLFQPQKKYSFFIDVRWNLERLSKALNHDCIKIMHIDTAHTLFHNAAESNRLLSLQERKGITLAPRRFEMPNLAIEHADCATTAGNEFTIGTFNYAKKPIYRVPQPPCVVFPFPVEKKFGSCRKNYLWFNSGGFVHKGLDLVLEAFAKMDDYNLFICGPIEREKDFENVFYKELYETKNIHTIGWVDVYSPEFTQLANKCIGIVSFSCSEGGGGSIIQCMHAGLIPIVSYETSVDVNENFGIVLKKYSIDTIIETIKTVSALPEKTLKDMSLRSWEYVRANHTREEFIKRYRKIILDITEKYSVR